MIAESSRSVVRDSSGSGNPAPEGDGIGLFGSRHIRVLDSSFRRNGLGMHVADSTNNVIKRNRFSRNGPSRNGPGIIIEADHNQVRRNRCARNGVCVLVAPGSRNVIAWNHSFRDKNGSRSEGARQRARPQRRIRVADGIYLGLLSSVGGVTTLSAEIWSEERRRCVPVNQRRLSLYRATSQRCGSAVSTSMVAGNAG